MTTSPTNPATPGPQPANPNDLLAEDITQALVDAGCIKDNHRVELLTKLKGGGVSQDDWNLWVDLATAPDVDGEEAGDE